MGSVLTKIVVHMRGFASEYVISAPVTHVLPAEADRWEVYDDAGRVQFMAVNEAGEVIQFQVYAPGTWSRWEGYA